MARNHRRQGRRRALLRRGIGLLAAFLAVSALAFVQARAATTFVPDGAPLDALLPKPLPQQLGALLSGVRIPRPLNCATPADHYLPHETRMLELINWPMLQPLSAWRRLP